MDFILAIWAKVQAVFDMAMAGAIGALVSLKFHPDVKDFGQRVFTVGSGAAVAHYVTPLALSHFNLPIERAGSVAFLLGLFGMSFAAAVIKAAKNVDLAGWVKSWLPSRGE